MELLILLGFLTGWFVCWTQMSASESQQVKQLQLDSQQMQSENQQMQSRYLEQVQEYWELVKELESEKLQRQQLKTLLAEHSKTALAWKKATEWDLQ